MRVYVQSHLVHLGYRWVEVGPDGARSLGKAEPRADLRDLLRSASVQDPTLIVAAAPDGGWVVLASTIPARPKDAPHTVVLHSFLVELPAEREGAARALAAAMLDPGDGPDDAAATLASAFLRRLNGFVDDAVSQSAFAVDPGILAAIEAEAARPVGEAEPDDPRQLGARNTPPRRRELAAWLRRCRLPRPAAADAAVPLVVVTGTRDWAPVVAAGAWRILTELVPHDDWRDPRARRRLRPPTVAPPPRPGRRRRRRRARRNGKQRRRSSPAPPPQGGGEPGGRAAPRPAGRGVWIAAAVVAIVAIALLARRLVGG